MNAEKNCQSCEHYKDGIALAFQLGIAFGFAKRYDEMDKIIEEIKKAVTPQKESEEE